MRSIISLAAVALCCGCAVSSPSKSAARTVMHQSAGARAIVGQLLADLPFTLQDNRRSVAVRVDQSGPSQFMFDTGALYARAPATAIYAKPNHAFDAP